MTRKHKLGTRSRAGTVIYKLGAENRNHKLRATIGKYILRERAGARTEVGGQ